MPTMTATTKVEKKAVETAFEKMNLQDRLEELWDIIDEMELDSELELSWQECLKGEHEDVFEALDEIKKELAESRNFLHSNIYVF